MKKILTICILLMLPFVAHAAEKSVWVEVAEDSYAYIFSIAADGSVTLLLPNSNMPDNFVKAGRAYQFPPTDGRIHLKAMFLPNCKDTSAEERIKIEEDI